MVSVLAWLAVAQRQREEAIPGAVTRIRVRTTFRVYDPCLTSSIGGRRFFSSGERCAATGESPMGLPGSLAHGQLDRVVLELAGVAELELLFDVSLIRLDGLHAYVQDFGNLTRTPSRANQPEDLELAIA
jgi:hypothetical protein